MSDPLADMLTRIRNGVRAGFDSVKMPSSKMKVSVAEVLKDEGFISGYSVEDDNLQGVLKIDLKYGPSGEPVIRGIKRTSRPGLRRYSKCAEIPRVLEGFGIAVVSTSKGVVADQVARSMNVGGEIICEVW